MMQGSASQRMLSGMVYRRSRKQQHTVVSLDGAISIIKHYRVVCGTAGNSVTQAALSVLYHGQLLCKQAHRMLL